MPSFDFLEKGLGIIRRITRIIVEIIVEINIKDVKLVKTNILSLHSKRHLQSIFTTFCLGIVSPSHFVCFFKKNVSHGNSNN